MKVKYFFGIVGFIGIAMLVVAFFIYINANKFLSKSIETEGSIIALRSVTNPTSDQSSAVLYKPLIRFSDLKGNPVEFHSSIGSQSNSYYNIGDKITILYNSEDPNKARIKTFSSLWAECIIIGIFGIVFISIGIVFFIIRKKIKNI